MEKAIDYLLIFTDVPLDTREMVNFIISRVLSQLDLGTISGDRAAIHFHHTIRPDPDYISPLPFSFDLKEKIKELFHEFNWSLSTERMKLLPFVLPQACGVVAIQFKTAEQCIQYTSENLLDSDTAMLFWASLNGDISIAKEALNRGIDVNVKSRIGATPLMYACLHYTRSNVKEFIEFLLENGANVNSKTLRGETPLHAVTDRGNIEAIKLLVKNGADFNAKRDDGATPRTISAQKGYPKIGDFFDSVENRELTSRTLPLFLIGGIVGISLFAWQFFPTNYGFGKALLSFLYGAFLSFFILGSIVAVPYALYIKIKKKIVTQLLKRH